CEVALQPKQLREAVAREPGGWVPGLHETLSGTASLLESVPPGSVQLQDLGAVHEAASGERDDLRLQRPPVAERPCPLARAADLEHLLAGEDHAAVDDPG